MVDVYVGSIGAAVIAVFLVVYYTHRWIWGVYSRRINTYLQHAERWCDQDEEDAINEWEFRQELREEARRLALRKEAARINDRIDRARVYDKIGMYLPEVQDILMSDPDR